MAEIVLASFPNVALAQPLIDFLAENELFASLSPNDVGGALPSIGFATGGADVLVEASDLERAKVLLEDYLAPTDEAGITAEATANDPTADS